MSDYNLTLGEALRLAVDEGKIIEWDGLGHGTFFFGDNGLENSKGLPITGNFSKSTKFHIKKEPVKLVTWWRPKVVWHKSCSYPEHWSDIEFYRSKVLWRKDNCGYKVLVWGSVDAPETFEQVEVGE